MLQRENQRITNGSIWLVSIPPGAHPREFAIFSLPRAHRKRQFSTPKLLIDLIYVFWNIFFSYNSTKRRCWVYWGKDNGYRKRRGTELLKERLLYGTLQKKLLDRIFLSLYICVRFRPFSYKFSYHCLKLGWRNISVLLFQKVKSRILVRIIPTFVSVKF